MIFRMDTSLYHCRFISQYNYSSCRSILSLNYHLLYVCYIQIIIILLLRNELCVVGTTNNTYQRLTINQGESLTYVDDDDNYDDNDGNDYDYTMMSMS